VGRAIRPDPRLTFCRCCDIIQLSKINEEEQYERTVEKGLGLGAVEKT